MKAIIVFLLTFVVGVAAASGAKVMMTKPPVAKATDSSAAHDSSKAGADSTHTDTAAAAAATPVAPPADTMPVPGMKPGAATDSAAAKTAAKTASPTAPAPVALTPQQDSAAKEPERRLAKVFTSMDASQAAKVLEHMSDGDVQVILGYVGTRQAAAILAALPPERVAAISKQTIQGAKR